MSEAWQGRTWPGRWWEPVRPLDWPAGPTRRVLLAGLSVLHAHTWRARFLRDLPEPLSLLESSSTGGGTEYLNFTARLVSCGTLGSRVRTWEQLPARAAGQPLLLMPSTLTPAFKAVEVIAQVWPHTPHLLVDVPGAGDLAVLTLWQDGAGLGSAGWDVLIACPHALCPPALAALATHLPSPVSQVSASLRLLGPEDLLLVTRAGVFRLRG